MTRWTIVVVEVLPRQMESASWIPEHRDVDKKDKRAYGRMEGHISALTQTRGRTNRQTDGSADEQTIRET